MSVIRSGRLIEILKFGGFLATIYLGILVVLYFAQRSLIYHTDPAIPRPAAFGVPEMTPVTLRSDDGLSLLAWWHPPRDAGTPVIVYYHGNGGHLGYRGRKVRPYLDRGYGVLLVAWRGYSGNRGSPTEAGLYADGRAALRFLDENAIEAKRRVLYGESLGSGVAVEMALSSSPGALVLEAPYTSLADVAAERFSVFPARWLVRDRYDSLTKIERVSAPVFVIHGERDGVIPVQFGRDLLEAANPPKQGVFLPQAGHNDLYEHGAGREIIGFLQSVFGK